MTAWNEDNSRIRTGHREHDWAAPLPSAFARTRHRGKLHRTPRLLLDYLKMSANTRPKPAIA